MKERATLLISLWQFQEAYIFVVYCLINKHAGTVIIVRHYLTSPMEVIQIPFNLKSLVSVDDMVNMLISVLYLCSSVIDTLYHPFLLDDPELTSGKHRKVLNLKSYTVRPQLSFNFSFLSQFVIGL